MYRKTENWMKHKITINRWIKNCAAGIGAVLVALPAATSTGAVAQTPSPVWLPAPPRVQCSTLFGTDFRISKSIPSPIVVGQPYELAVYNGAEIFEYYFELVGSQLRLNLRRGAIQNNFDAYCYRFSSPPVLHSDQFATLVQIGYARAQSVPPIYETIPGISTFPLAVITHSHMVPSLGIIAIAVLLVCVTAIASSAMRIFGMFFVCNLLYLCSGFISEAQAQETRSTKGEDAAAQRALQEVSILLRHDAPGLTVSALARAVIDEKGSSELKRLIPGAVSARALMYRPPTIFEQTLNQKFPDDPLARLFRYVVVEYKDQASRDAALEGLRRDKTNFEYISLNTPVRFSAAPTDLFLGTSATTATQWGMHLLRFNGQWVSGVWVDGAWDKTHGRAYVAVLDNGIETDHPDLIKNYRHHLSTNLFARQYFDEPDELITPHPSGGTGHGTHVASIMASSHNDGYTAGGCPECSLVAIRELRYLNEFAVGVARAVDTGMQVLNMSFETLPDTQYNCLTTHALIPMCLALTHAKNNGMTVVTAAGNNGNFTTYSSAATPHTELWPLPAAHPDVLAVSGLQFNGINMSFWTGAPGPAASGYFGSNYGAVNNGVPQISFSAPGVEIVASIYHGQSWTSICSDAANPAGSINTDGVGFCTGTSMAAPHISAMAGLVKSANPLLETAGVKSVLIQSAECLETGTNKPCNESSPLGGVPGDAMKKLGYGVPKADKAVQIALGGPTAKNRLTPLFAYYQINDTASGISQGRTHFYTTNPQMAIAAKRNTLLPAPKYKFDPSEVNCGATPTHCNSTIYADIALTEPATIKVRNPDNTPASAADRVFAVFEATQNGTSNAPIRARGETFSTVANTLSVLKRFGADNFTETAVPTSVGTSVTLKPISISTYPLRYTEIGLPISGYPNLPCGSTFSYDPLNNPTVAINGACQYFPARALAMLLTTHINPVNESQPLKKVYRLSCAPEDVCNASNDAATKPYHVTFRYVTDINTVDAMTTAAQGYKLDGIEGYIHSLAFAQPPGTKKLCAKRHQNNHDHILFLEDTMYPDAATGTLGATSSCDLTISDKMAGGDGYALQPIEAGTGVLGYAYPVQQPKALPEATPPPSQSFNGDQYADIFWLRTANGADSSVWFQQGEITLANSAAATPAFANDPNWKVVGTGDINGDGKADIVWRGINGNLGQTKIWFMNGAVHTDFIFPASFSPNYEIVGVGDVNGDGKSDIIWRSTLANNGGHVIWYMNGNSIAGWSSFFFPAWMVPGNPVDDWKIVGTVDLNGDGKADFFFRNQNTGGNIAALTNVTSTAITSTAITFQWLPAVQTNLRVAGVADISGDGHADVVWMETGVTGSKCMIAWLMVSAQYVAGNYLGCGIDASFQPVSVKDFDGDGRADVLWRHTSGYNAM